MHVAPLSRRAFVARSLAALATPGLLSSCTSLPTQPLSVSPRLTARPGSPTIPPVRGMSRLGLGDQRDGMLYVPQTYTGATALPLMVALHGTGRSGDWWSDHIDEAEEHGFIILAPDSRDFTWDASLMGFGPDVIFLDRALRHVFARCRIDVRRLALVGYSDGASYTLSLGVSNGDLFSHLIAYAPGYYRPDAPRIGDPAIFIAHGTQDSVLPFAHTAEVVVPELREAGYRVEFVPFEGGHGVPEPIAHAALAWFLPAAEGGARGGGRQTSLGPETS
jgi:phospholipase/carboxylesterase